MNSFTKLRVVTGIREFRINSNWAFTAGKGHGIGPHLKQSTDYPVLCIATVQNKHHLTQSEVKFTLTILVLHVPQATGNYYSNLIFSKSIIKTIHKSNEILKL